MVRTWPSCRPFSSPSRRPSCLKPSGAVQLPYQSRRLLQQLARRFPKPRHHRDLQQPRCHRPRHRIRTLNGLDIVGIELAGALEVGGGRFEVAQLALDAAQVRGSMGCSANSGCRVSKCSSAGSASG